jgi:hypothetical protein
MIPAHLPLCRHRSEAGWLASAASAIAGLLGTGHLQLLRVQQSSLHRHGGLVPVDVLIRELAAPECDAANQRHLHACRTKRYSVAPARGASARVGVAGVGRLPRAKTDDGRLTRWEYGAVRDHTATPVSPSLPTAEGVTPMGTPIADYQVLKTEILRCAWCEFRTEVPRKALAGRAHAVFCLEVDRYTMIALHYRAVNSMPY